MNIIDKAIALVSPSLALKRVTNQAKLQMMDRQVRRWEGAAHGPRFSSFGNAKTESVNQAIARDQRNLVARSQYLTNNNPYAKRAPRLIANNVIGTGIVPTFADLSGKKKNVTSISAAWSEWAGGLSCDYDGNYTFYGLQKLAMKNIVVDGTVFIVRKRVKSSVNRFGIQVLMLGSEYLDRTKHTYTGGIYSNDGYDFYGIRYDADNKRVGYWIYERNPLDGNIKSTLIPAKDIVHLFEVDRPQQYNGVPFAASTILTQKDVDDYADAELMGKKAAACMPIFVTNSDPEASGGGEGEGDEDDDRLEILEPGSINYLKPNEQVTIAQPPQNPGYSEYMKTNYRAIAAGYGCTYEQLTGDFSNVNFSSGRMGWIEFQRNVDDWQHMLIIPKFCEPILKWFLEACEIVLGIKPGTVIATWTPPRREMIDPVKETNALRAQSRAGFKSWQEIVRSQGDDPEVVFRQMEEDYKRFIAANMTPEWSPYFLQKMMMENSGKASQANMPTTDREAA